MKPSYPNNFARGQKLVRYLLALSIVAALAGWLLYAENSTAQVLCIVLSLAMMIALVVTILRDCRCPHCGKRILAGALAVKVCPSCHRDLRSGKKVKTSRR